MSSWAERMQARAADLGVAVTTCGGHSSNIPQFRRIEKVKFGVVLGEVCKNDIPGPLLVLILKLNKEAPYKKDVFRAPGHQANMKKLIHFLQTGRLVNIDNFSVYTIASVLKKFFRKLPEGIFGIEGEAKLFQIIELHSIEEQRDQVSWYTIVFLRLALGVSVAPSFFQSCVSDGKQARMEDVLKFKAEVDVATKIMKFLIDNFGVSNLFGRENYEYYARITGRILKVEEDWIFSFRFPLSSNTNTTTIQDQQILSSELENEVGGIVVGGGFEEEEEVTVSEKREKTSCENPPPENPPLLDTYTRLSISLEDNALFKDSFELSASSTFSLNQLQTPPPTSRGQNQNYTTTTIRSTLHPQVVQERQAARMKTRSEWFLSPQPEGTTTTTTTTTTSSTNRRCTNQPSSTPTTTNTNTAALPLREGSFKKKNTNSNNNNNHNNNNGGSSTKETSRRSQQQQLIRRTSSKKKKDKENGQQNSNNSGGGGGPSNSEPNPLPLPPSNLTSTNNPTPTPTTTTTTTATIDSDSDVVLVDAPQEEVGDVNLEQTPTGSYKPRI